MSCSGQQVAGHNLNLAYTVYLSAEYLENRHLQKSLQAKPKMTLILYWTKDRLLKAGRGVHYCQLLPNNMYRTTNTVRSVLHRRESTLRESRQDRIQAAEPSPPMTSSLRLVRPANSLRACSGLSLGSSTTYTANSGFLLDNMSVQ